jgi:protein-ribulosamine 3-kinase
MLSSYSLTTIFKERFHIVENIQVSSVSGGSINSAYRISNGTSQWFCKINSATKFPQLFEKEKKGLELLHVNGVKTPVVIDSFEAEGQQLLVLEWINETERTEKFWKDFGKTLAELHQVSGSSFGLNFDNYMGSVPQSNQPMDNWINFLIHRRLLPLIEKCNGANLLTTKHQDQFESLFQKLPTFFNDDEKPSLLHGDLWSGNFMCDENADPILIDPAVYFGHPAVDLGMTMLFGGFNSAFYEGYHYHAPLPSREQCDICNLYPLLIHLYLFGQSYLSQINKTLKQFA